jgi:hypothetical protein
MLGDLYVSTKFRTPCTQAKIRVRIDKGGFYREKITEYGAVTFGVQTEFVALLGFRWYTIAGVLSAQRLEVESIKKLSQ